MRSTSGEDGIPDRRRRGLVAVDAWRAVVRMMLDWRVTREDVAMFDMFDMFICRWCYRRGNTLAVLKEGKGGRVTVGK